MNMSLGRVKRLLPDSEYQIVRQLVRAKGLPDEEVARLRTLVRGWRDKYVDRAHQQSREARGKGKPRSTRGSESNENTMRQADVMDWALERLDELAAESKAGPEAAAAPTERSTTPVPSADELRKVIGEPHVSTFGDLWAEFPDTPVEKIRKVLWQLVEEGDVELTTAGGIELTAEEEVAFVEEVQTIEGVPVKRRTQDAGIDRKHQDHFARTKVVRIHAHNRARGSRKQARRDNRGR